jgi:hypothetical protein
MRWTKLYLICIYFKKYILTHHCFNFSSSIWNSWIDRVIFFSFFGSVRFASAQLGSSPPFLLPSVVSPPVDIVTPSHRFTLPSHRTETEALNPHDHSRPPSPNRPTHILHCYKKIISILVTFPTTQSRLHFASSLARAPRYRSSTRHCCFLSPLSHVYRPSTQWHSRGWTSRLSYTFRTTSRRVIN